MLMAYEMLINLLLNFLTAKVTKRARLRKPVS